MKRARGVFGQCELLELLKAKRLVPLSNFSKKHVGPASVDLTTTGEVYKVDHLIQPDQRTKEKIRDLIPLMGGVKLPVERVTFEVGSTYLAKASIDVNFPPGLYGFLNAKSSSGRNFLFVRALADGVHMFDSVDKRHQGCTAELWLVIMPLAYPIVVDLSNPQECFNQLRVFNADTRFSQSDLDDFLVDHDLLFRRDGDPYRQEGLSLFTHDGSILCTLRAKQGEIIGFVAKRGAPALDLRSRKVRPGEYFEPVYAESVGGIDFVRIEAGRYYLLATNERLKISTCHTAELEALDTRLGFFFSHFAGFFDPGFFGTATLEIFSPHDIVLRHKQPVARFVLERLVSETVSYERGGNYFAQVRTTLPKQFMSWK